MLSPHFSFSVTINGRIATNPADLNNFTKQELWDALANMMGTNIQLKSEVERLTGICSHKEAEIMTLRAELADLADVKSRLLSLIEENKILVEKLAMNEEKLVVFEQKLNHNIREHESTRSELDSMKQQLRQMTEALCAREIGMKTDELVRKFIFADSVKKPYYLRSFKNLLSFIDDPIQASKSSLCGERASDEWFKLTESDRQAIIRKSRLITEKSPELKESIENLKGNWTTAHPKCDNFDAIVAFSQQTEDTETAESLLVCQPFYDKSIFEQIIAVDENSKTEIDSSS